MGNNDRYFYFRFLNTFFRDKTIRDMKNFPMHGYIFVVIYLKICALSTEDRGELEIPVYGEIPYIETIAKEIGEDTNITGAAISYFISNGLIRKIQSETGVKLLISHVIDNTGVSSRKADRVRRLERLRKENNLLPGENAEEKIYGEYRNVKLLDYEYEDLKNKYSDIDNIIDKLDIDKEIGLTETEKPDYEFIIELIGRMK